MPLPSEFLQGLLSGSALVPVLAAAPLIPWAIVQTIKIRFQMRRDATWLELASLFGQSVHQLQVERGQTVAQAIRVQASITNEPEQLKTPLAARLASVHQATDQTLRGLEDGFARLAQDLPPVSRLAELQTEARMAVARALALRTMVGDDFPTPAAVMTLYSAAIAAVLAFTTGLLTQSQRGKAADLGQAYLNLITAKEYAARERGQMNAALTSGRFGGVARRLQDLLDEQRVLLEMVCQCADRSLAAEAATVGAPPPRLLEMRQALAQSDSVPPTFTAADWFAVSSGYINGLKALEDRLADAMLAASGRGRLLAEEARKAARRPAGSSLASLTGERSGAARAEARSGARTGAGLLSGSRPAHLV